MDGSSQDDQTKTNLKTVEISHGSDYSKVSSRSISPDIAKSIHVSICELLIVFVTLTVLVLVATFWFGDIGEVSGYLKKHIRYRLPVIVSLSALSCIVVGVVLFCIWKRQSRRKRGSYVEQQEPYKPTQNNLLPTVDESFVSQSSGHSVSFRQNLDVLPKDAIKEIKEILLCYQKDVSLSGHNVAAERHPLKRELNYPFRGTRNHTFTSTNVYTDYLFVKDTRGLDVIDHDVDVNAYQNFREGYYNVYVKLLLIGDTNVGKTSIFHRILYDQFSETYITTLGCDIGVTNISYYDRNQDREVHCNIHVWDIGGSIVNLDISEAMLKDTTLFLAVCDASSPLYDGLQEWIIAIRNSVDNPNIVILINKTDLETIEITQEELKKVGNLSQLPIYSVSAKTGAGIDAAFEESILYSLLADTAKLTIDLESVESF